VPSRSEAGGSALVLIALVGDHDAEEDVTPGHKFPLAHHLRIRCQLKNPSDLLSPEDTTRFFNRIEEGVHVCNPTIGPVVRVAGGERDQLDLVTLLSTKLGQVLQHHIGAISIARVP
jgi:hypothetical protein